MFTALAVPASLLAKAADCVNVTLLVSAVITPTNTPGLKVAVVVPSYTLLATLVLATVSALAVMSADSIVLACVRL